MEKLSNIISRLMMGGEYGKRSRQGPIFERWPEVVGDLMARKCRPTAVRKGVLVVQVVDSVWMHELQMQKVLILERVRELTGEGTVVDIRWTLRGETPFHTHQSTSSASPAPPLRPLSFEEKAWVRTVSAEVADSGLQATLKRLLTKYLQARPPD